MILPLDPGAFAERGYAVLPGLFSPGDVAELRAEAAAVCKGKRGIVDGLALSEPQELDDDAMRRFLCIHHPHKISPLLKSTFERPGLVSALTAIIGPNI